MTKLAKLELSGGFRLTTADGCDAAITSRKARGLLAILALSPGQSATRARLRGLLWSDRGEQQAGDSLRQLLATLRKELAEAGLDIIQSRDDTLTLATCDVLQIDDGNAMDRAHGELLAGLDVGDNAFEEWLASERRAHAVRLTEIFERIMARETGAARVTAARKLVAIDPLREASHRALIASLLETGEAALALKQLEDCRTILKRELGVAPTAETLALLNATPAPARNFAAAKPVIAIMPFDDLSNDQSQRYFSEGISREIATELARFREFVIRYCHPGQQTTAGSDYTISGSVRRSGPTIRISVELADTVSGTHYWGDRFVAGEQELFGLQDRIVQSIAARLAHHLNVAGLEKSQRRPPANLAAYELVLRGEAYFGDPELEPASIPLFTKALELDPQCARAYGSLGEVVMIQWTLDLDAPESELHRAVAMVEKAVALDPSDANIQANYANVLMWNRQFERAALHCTKALTLNPSSPVIRAFQGILHAFRGEPIEGARCFDQALALDPQFDPGWFTRNRAMVHFMARQYRAAADLFSQSPHRRHWAELYCAAAHAYLGEINDARRHVAIAHAMNPRQSIARCVGREPYARPEDSAHFAEGLRRAGLPE